MSLNGCQRFVATVVKDYTRSKRCYEN